MIAQDKGLAADILALNGSQSVDGHPVSVESLNGYGFLSKTQPVQQADKKAIVPESTNKISPIDRFPWGTKVTTVPDDLLPVSQIPKVGDNVLIENHDARGVIRLEQAVATGGEGTIYTTNTNFVAKIYKKEKLSRRHYEKIKLMLSKGIQYEGICYPTACLYNEQKEFVGYMMPKAQGTELQKSLFIKPLLLKKFPDWKKRDTVQLCITILEKIQYLHDRNIIMGDINPSNILVVSPTEVYFVDTDSYQLGNFPCPVGTVNFTAPEIQGKKFSEFLRTMGNENFAVATLLFMILLPGKPPYSQQGGANPDNVINMDFSYPFEGQSNQKVPEGPWRYIWSHLTKSMKRNFYNTFHKSGDYSRAEKRLSVKQWLKTLKQYLWSLDNGIMAENDSMSEELFPARRKKNPDKNYVTCRLCRHEVEDDWTREGICVDCLKGSESYPCSMCGDELTITNHHKYLGSGQRHELCSKCFSFQNGI